MSRETRKPLRKYAIKVSGYGGEVYALFEGSKRTGTSLMVSSDERHKAELRLRGYKVLGGTVKE